ncbi:4'-phosphopantetheinyl transferase superfamily protein [Fulvivirga sp. M361]|uniref:4'-phosphopantetheinyl transferase family protein n=1 Tax=Fulvivirga sp. M361 TaxID=2594266 RepID=UPI001179DBA3|nr:4'-phosphopantetheinyl transferase family protein [Fulvivirga sp. M361]TRX53795.1 4'-phosphopantetheinyl transferase superfamily protein [Fulvivirga sp. M361]
MPLIRIERVTENRLVALWKITESYEWFVKELQPPVENLELIGSYRSEHKKMEWLAGRLTVKRLMENAGLSYHGISKNYDGKPLLSEASAEISLTHSYPYVAAILDTAQNEVGIDLEQPKDTLRRIAHKFLNEPEKKFVNNNLNKLCICWCVKESLYKIYSKRGISFSKHLHVPPFELNQEGVISGSIIVNGSKKSYKLQYEVNSDFILTYSL